MKTTTLNKGLAELRSDLAIDREWLTDSFLEMIQIDSPPKGERELALWCREKLEEFGAECHFDEAGVNTGGEVGNLHALFPGRGPGDPILLSAHLDTVPEAVGVEPIIDQGCVRTDGTKPLGADDKSGLAAILTVIKALKNHRTAHPDIQIFLSVQEELGLLGTRNGNLDRLQSSYGYVLDGGSVDRLIYRAPAKNHFSLTFIGREAHLTREPELGMNAAQMAALAIAAMPLGRINQNTTANVESVHSKGGSGQVPARCEIIGEVASHDLSQLERATGEIHSCAREAIRGNEVSLGGKTWSAELESIVERQHPPLIIPNDHPVLERAKKAALLLGRSLQLYTASGGSDANIFSAHGVPCAVLGTGMALSHTPQENIRLDDLCRTAELLLAILVSP